LLLLLVTLPVSAIYAFSSPEKKPQASKQGANGQQAAPTPRPLLRMPDIFGDRVVFVCEGDLWLGELATGRATRLTPDESREEDPVFSPDGKQIAFTATYDGAPEVYVIPVEGGAPRRITYRGQYLKLMDWTPDGKNVVFTAAPQAGKS